MGLLSNVVGNVLPTLDRKSGVRGVRSVRDNPNHQKYFGNTLTPFNDPWCKTGFEGVRTLDFLTPALHLGNSEGVRRKHPFYLSFLDSLHLLHVLHPKNDSLKKPPFSLEAASDLLDSGCRIEFRSQNLPHPIHLAPSGFPPLLEGVGLKRQETSELLNGPWTTEIAQWLTSAKSAFPGSTIKKHRGLK